MHGYRNKRHRDYLKSIIFAIYADSILAGLLCLLFMPSVCERESGKMCFEVHGYRNKMLRDYKSVTFSIQADHNILDSYRARSSA